MRQKHDVTTLVLFLRSVYVRGVSERLKVQFEDLFVVSTRESIARKLFLIFLTKEKHPIALMKSQAQKL
jgi:hypothetical protein